MARRTHVRARDLPLPGIRSAGVVVAAVALWPLLGGGEVALGAQEVGHARIQENLRAAPNGPRIGTVEPGTELRLGRRDGDWIEATLEGWIWIRSLQMLERGRYDLVVSVEGGENVRSRPSGPVIARVDRDTVLEELERVPGWIRARRTGWIWMPSLEVSGDVDPEGDPETSETQADAPDPGAARGEGDERTPPTSEAPSSRWRRAGERGAAVLTGPDGDTLAVTRPRAELEILGREGSWARVRVEGWTWLPPRDESADTTVLRGVTPREVVAEPDRYRGGLVEWELQFISLERAEPIRTDFYEGEPFLLTRARAEGTFVYVAVPADRLGEVEGLTPLETITVVGRVRTGSAALTESPILDLLELVRGPGGG